MCHWELLLTASKSEKAQFLHCAYSALNNVNLYLRQKNQNKIFLQDYKLASTSHLWKINWCL